MTPILVIVGIFALLAVASFANESAYYQDGRVIDYTPTAAKTGGQIVQINSLAALMNRDIGASELGAAQVDGVITGPFVGGVANIGDNVWWDATGTPYGGAADGAYTCVASNGDWWVGTLTEATVAASATCKFALNKANPNLPAWPNRTHFTVAADTTLVAATHSGGVIHVTKDAGTDTVITLPVGVAGMDYIIVNDEADGGNLLQVDLNGTEIIAGANLTVTNGKLAQLTKATGLRGDYLHLECNVNATSWRVKEKRGVWVCSA